MLATVEQLRQYLHTEGAVRSGAAIDAGLLERVLRGASARLEEARPERTIDLVPAPVNAGTDNAPDWQEGDSVELAFTLRANQRVLQVPDLRELEAATFTPHTAAGLGSLTELDVTGWELTRRPRELCALWVRLPYTRWVRGELRIRGLWGPAGAKVGTPLAELAVRDDVLDAVLVWAARAYHNRTARFADTVQDPGGGVSSYFRNLPPDVKLVIDSLEVPGL